MGDYLGLLDAGVEPAHRLLRAITVVNIEVHDGHLLDLVSVHIQCVRRADGHIVDEAEAVAVGPAALDEAARAGVVARRADRAEGIARGAACDKVHGVDDGTRAVQRGVEGLLRYSGVAVQAVDTVGTLSVAAYLLADVLNAAYIRPLVHAQNIRYGGTGCLLHPFQLGCDVGGAEGSVVGLNEDRQPLDVLRRR